MGRIEVSAVGAAFAIICKVPAENGASTTEQLGLGDRVMVRGWG